MKTILNKDINYPIMCRVKGHHYIVILYFNESDARIIHTTDKSIKVGDKCDWEIHDQKLQFLDEGETITFIQPKVKNDT